MVRPFKRLILHNNQIGTFCIDCTDTPASDFLGKNCIVSSQIVAEFRSAEIGDLATSCRNDKLSVCPYDGGRRTPSPLKRGSMRSRKPSPIRFNPSTVIMIAAPETVETQGALRRNSRPSLITPPQVGVGGWTPRPRKLREASIRIASAALTVAMTMMR